jgi:hypothetical protein
MGSRLFLPFAASGVSWRETESCEVLREGGPTKSEGAGRRLGLVFEVGEGLFGFAGCVVDDMVSCMVSWQCERST